MSVKHSLFDTVNERVFVLLFMIMQMRINQITETCYESASYSSPFGFLIFITSDKDSCQVR